MWSAFPSRTFTTWLKDSGFDVEQLGRDLQSFGTPILVLGDPAQLPPISGGGFFTEVEPDVMLTEVHRQAADNPIVRMSMIVREGGRLDDERLLAPPPPPSSRSAKRKKS